MSGRATVACGLTAHVEGGTIVDVQGRENHPVSRGRLCAKGMAFVQGIGDSRRIVQPALRQSRNDPFKALESWDSALDLLAERLRKVRDQSGPESLVIGCDPEAGPGLCLPCETVCPTLGYIFRVPSVGRARGNPSGYRGQARRIFPARHGLKAGLFSSSMRISLPAIPWHSAEPSMLSFAGSHLIVAGQSLHADNVQKPICP